MPSHDVGEAFDRLLGHAPDAVDLLIASLSGDDSLDECIEECGRPANADTVGGFRCLECQREADERVDAFWKANQPHYQPYIDRQARLDAEKHLDDRLRELSAVLDDQAGAHKAGKPYGTRIDYRIPLMDAIKARSTARPRGNDWKHKRVRATGSYQIWGRRRPQYRALDSHTAWVCIGHYKTRTYNADNMRQHAEQHIEELWRTQVDLAVRGGNHYDLFELRYVGR